MLHKEENGTSGVVGETVALLDWAEERGVIKKVRRNPRLFWTIDVQRRTRLYVRSPANPSPRFLLIAQSQHDALLKEFSRRLESRGLRQTTQNSSRDNLVALGVKSIGGLGKRLARRKNEEEEHFLDFEFSSDEKGEFSKEDCVVS